MTDLVEDVAAFGGRLRDEGLGVDVGALAAFAEGCARASPRDAYWVGRATLVSRHEDVPAYDRAFAAHFGPGPAPPAVPEEREAATPELALVPPDAAEGDDEAREVTPASAAERLRDKRFGKCTEEELRQLAALIARIGWELPPRPARRRRRSRRGRLDVRRTLRAAVRARDPATWTIHRRERRVRRRPLILLLDVSGSMAAYSRVLLVFAHGALAADARWEAFSFGTRLTRLTPALRAGSPDAALRAAFAEVADWHGGTRIGDALKALLDRWGQTRALRGSVVVVCSDGLEVGEPDTLGEQMARLSRVAREVIWLNPLEGLEGYEPLARGMAAALPHVDVFASGDTLASLERIADHVAGARPGRRALTQLPGRTAAHSDGAKSEAG